MLRFTAFLVLMLLATPAAAQSGGTLYISADPSSAFDPCLVSVNNLQLFCVFHVPQFDGFTGSVCSAPLPPCMNGWATYLGDQDGVGVGSIGNTQSGSVH